MKATLLPFFQDLDQHVSEDPGAVNESIATDIEDYVKNAQEREEAEKAESAEKDETKPESADESDDAEGSEDSEGSDETDDSDETEEPPISDEERAELFSDEPIQDSELPAAEEEI